MKKKNKIVACIEARMTSSRLPGKVLKKISGRTVLEILIKRLSESKYIDEVIIAATDRKEDDPIEKLGKELGVFTFRGSEDDVLGRVVGAVEAVNGDIIVEITGDCPLMDPGVVDSVIEKYLSEDKKYDYVTNIGYVGDSIREIPIGMDVRVFSFKDLKAISEITNDPEDREHVSLYFFRTGKDKYRLFNIGTPEKWKRDYNPRLCLDTKEDLELIKNIYETLYPLDENFKLEDILNFLDKNRETLKVNSMIIQKTVKDLE